MKLASYMRGLGIGMAVTALLLHFSGDTSKQGMTDEEVRARAVELGMTDSLTMDRLNTVTDGDSVSGNASVYTELPNVGVTQEEQSVSDNLLSGLLPDGETEDGKKEEKPTEKSTATPTEKPTATPTEKPTATPAEKPTATPAEKPTATPTEKPTATPTEKPTATPTEKPTATPTPTVKPANVVTPTTAPSQSGGEGNRALNTEEKSIQVYSGDGSYTVSCRLVEAGVVSSATEFDKFMCVNGYDRKIATGVHKIPAGATYLEICQILTSRSR